MTRFRVLVASALLAAAIGSVLVGQTVQAQGPINLTAALLGAAELGPGWQVSTPASADPDGIAYGVSFERENNNVMEALDIVLINDPFGRPARAVEVIVEGLSTPVMNGVRLTNVSTTSASPPAVGQDAARTTVTATVIEGAMFTPVTFDVIAWRQGPVVAEIILFSTGQANALVYAQQQATKLANFLASQPAAATASAGTPVTAPFVGVLSCESFTHQEAAQALFIAFPGDPYGLDPDGNGVACDDLPRHTGAVSRPVTPTLAARPPRAQFITNI